jgi:hypothetical protein
LRESIRKKKIELLIQYQDPVLQWHRPILYGEAHLHLQHNPFEVFISLLFSEANLYLLLRFLYYPVIFPVQLLYETLTV